MYWPVELVEATAVKAPVAEIASIRIPDRGACVTESRTVPTITADLAKAKLTFGVAAPEVTETIPIVWEIYPKAKDVDTLYVPVGRSVSKR